ncbi:MAG: aspartate 1-decarboxylase [Dehalococcoidia bacterium]|nr:aspartate 1-decarboxylase [Dehalococcoidia bacterium]
MTRNMLKSKIHRARVTNVHLDYEGSITIDASLLKAADILPYEEVSVLNVNTGARFTTYAIAGRPGAGQVELNGAAARLAAKDDIVIILAYTSLPDAEATAFTPHLVYVNKSNQITGTRTNTDPTLGTLVLGA